MTNTDITEIHAIEIAAWRQLQDQTFRDYLGWRISAETLESQYKVLEEDVNNTAKQNSWLNNIRLAAKTLLESLDSFPIPSRYTAVISSLRAALNADWRDYF